MEVARGLMLSVSRPPDSTSRVNAAFATRKGFRYGTTQRLVNSRTVVVALAANDSATNGSSA